jgi:hypothetical protein
MILAFMVSCGTFQATISDISDDKQKIEVKITSVSFDSNEPLIERISISVENLSNSFVEILPEKCFFQDENGFHFMKIPPIRIPPNQNINLAIESIDYYKTETSGGVNTWGGDIVQVVHIQCRT